MTEQPTPAPFIRQPMLGGMMGVIPAIVIGLVMEKPLGYVIAVVLAVGEFVLLTWLFIRIRARMAEEHPGIFDRPVDGPPQGPVIS